jgi:predicted DNA-binding transcriptional regulator AlpA
MAVETSAEYLNTKQLEARSSVSASTWAKRRLTGDGPPFRKIGKSVRYFWPDVQSWLEAKTRTSTSDILGGL